MSFGDEVFANGLLEVGVFQKDGVRGSFRLHLGMLPAYPLFLAACAQAIADHLMPVNRIVCLPDSVPLGVAISLHTKIPLVYSRGQGEAPVQDWVGAYDTGHPVALICNILPDHETYLLRRKQLSSVGLDIVQVMGLVELHSLATDVPTHSLLSLVDWLRSSPQMLPAGAAQSMLSELENQN